MIQKERVAELIEKIRHGETTTQIAKDEGVTRQAISLLLRSYAKLEYKKAMQEARAAKKRLPPAHTLKRHATLRAKWPEQCKQLFGCSLEEFKSIIGDEYAGHYHAVENYPQCSAYWKQRINSRERGIGFRLTLKEWWAAWSESGKWAMRGRGGAHFGMSRISKDMPYQTGNVIIRTNAESTRASTQKVNRIAARGDQSSRPALGHGGLNAADELKITSSTA